MWNRQELKAKGNMNMKKNYWNSVLVAFIYSLFISASSYSVSNSRKNIDEGELQNVTQDSEALGIFLMVLGAVAVFMLVLYIVKILVLNPLNVGCNRFFLVNQDDKAAVNELGYGFKNNYGHSVVTILLMDILIGLGCILFIIPGIILTYSYRMVPYILAEEPQLGVVDVLKKSRAMMQGNKWSTFVFDLSFLGWFLLSIVTCGILSLFYVNPYYLNAKAALYQAIRDQYLHGVESV